MTKTPLHYVSKNEVLSILPCKPLTAHTPPLLPLLSRGFPLVAALNDYCNLIGL